MKTLEKFQLEGVDYIVRNPHALLGDEMGLGKTVQAVYAARSLRAKSGIFVVPACAKINWAYELEDAGFPKGDIAILRGWKKPELRPFTILNYELAIEPIVRDAICAHIWDFGVSDESHKLKNLESQRTKAVLGRGGIFSWARRRLCITGTPLLNRPREIYPILKTLFPWVIADCPDYSRFAYKFCAAHHDNFGRIDDRGASNTDELGRRLSTVMLRRTKAQVFPHWEAPALTPVYLERDPKLYASLNEKEMEMAAQDIKRNALAQNFVERGNTATLRRVMGIAKVPQMVAHIKDLLENVDKVAVFAVHKEVVRLLSEALKEYNPVVYVGDTSSSRREEAKRRFGQEADCRVFIGNVDAAGESINGLQKACHTISVVELFWSPKTMEQIFGRLDRMGQNSRVNAYALIVQDTVDTAMWGVMASKNHVINRVVLPTGVVNPTTKEREGKKTMMQKLEKLLTLLIACGEKYLAAQENASQPELPFEGVVPTGIEAGVAAEEKPAKKARAKKQPAPELPPVPVDENVDPLDGIIDQSAEVSQVIRPVRGGTLPPAPVKTLKEATQAAIGRHVPARAPAPATMDLATAQKRFQAVYIEYTKACATRKDAPGNALAKVRSMVEGYGVAKAAELSAEQLVEIIAGLEEEIAFGKGA